MREEIWKDIPRYEEMYQVSTQGVVKALGRLINLTTHSYYKKEKLLTQFPDGRGYLHVKLYDGSGNPKSWTTHRLVALTYIPNLENKPQVNHIDGNKLNNNIDNLEWCTNEENMSHLASLRRTRPSIQGENSKFSKTTTETVLNIRKDRDELNVSMKNLSLKYNVTIGNVWNIIYRKSWKHV